MAGCISKKEVFFCLRPHCKSPNSRVLRQFFDDARLQRIGLSEEQYLRVRIFPPDATAVIRQELEKMKFI